MSSFSTKFSIFSEGKKNNRKWIEKFYLYLFLWFQAFLLPSLFENIFSAFLTKTWTLFFDYNFKHEAHSPLKSRDTCLVKLRVDTTDEISRDFIFELKSNPDQLVSWGRNQSFLLFKILWIPKSIFEYRQQLCSRNFCALYAKDALINSTAESKIYVDWHNSSSVDLQKT